MQRTGGAGGLDPAGAGDAGGHVPYVELVHPRSAGAGDRQVQRLDLARDVDRARAGDPQAEAVLRQPAQVEMGGAADPGLGHVRGGHHDMDVRSRPPIAPLP